jgi:hypothetical protein
LIENDCLDGRCTSDRSTAEPSRTTFALHRQSRLRDWQRRECTQRLFLRSHICEITCQTAATSRQQKVSLYGNCLTFGEAATKADQIYALVRRRAPRRRSHSTYSHSPYNVVLPLAAAKSVHDLGMEPGRFLWTAHWKALWTACCIAF